MDLTNLHHFISLRFPSGKALKVTNCPFKEHWEYYPPTRRWRSGGSAGSELGDPLLVFLQVCGGDRFRNFLQSRLEILHGRRHVHLVSGNVTDLLRGQALDSPSHSHQRSVSAADR